MCSNMRWNIAHSESLKENIYNKMCNYVEVRYYVLSSFSIFICNQRKFDLTGKMYLAMCSSGVVFAFLLQQSSHMKTKSVPIDSDYESDASET